VTLAVIPSFTHCRPPSRCKLLVVGRQCLLPTSEHQQPNQQANAPPPPPPQNPPMSLPQVLRAHLQSILTNPLSAQLAPFLVLFLIPCLLLLLFLNINSHYTQRSKSYFLWSAAMVFESLGVGLPWNWTRANGAHHLSSASASSSSSSSVNGHERKKSKKKNVRSREQQLAVANGNARPGEYPPPNNMVYKYTNLTRLLHRILKIQWCR
jgi:hypothetical protein